MKNIAHIKNHKLTISQLEKIKSMDDLTFKTSGLEEFSNKLTKKLLGRTNNVWRNFTLEYYDEQGSDELEKTNTIVNQKISFDVSLIIEGQSEEKGTSRNLEHQSINNQNTKEIYKSSKELSNYWNKVENTFLGNSYKKYNYNSLTKSSYNVPSLFLKNSSHISNNSNMNSYFETKNQNNIFRGFSQKKEMFESYQDQIFSSIENSIKNKVVSLTRNFLIRNFSFFDKTVFKTNSSKTDKINNWHIQKINEQSNMQLLNNKQNINNLFADNLIQYLNMQNSELSFDDNNEQSNHTINNLLRSSNIGESFNTIVNSIVKSYSNKFKTASQNISVLYKDENSATNNKLKKENKLNASPRIKIEQRQGLHSFHDGVKRVKDIETFAIESLQYLDDNTDQIDQQQSSEISSIITNLVSFVYKNVGEVTNIDSLVNSYVDRLSSSSQNISVLYNDSINYKMKNVQKGIFKNEYAITGLIQRAMPQSVNGQNDKVINDRLTNQITSTHQLIDSENKFRSIEMFARESLQYLDENKDQLGEQQTNEISGIINNLISSVNKSNSQTDLNTYVNTYVDRLSSTSRNISVLYNNENHSRINNVDGAFGVDGKGTRSAGQRASLNKAAQTSGQREDEQIASGRVISKLITNTQRISDRENSPRSIEMFARESLQYLDENKDQLGEQQTNEISGIINNLISSVNKSNSQTDLNTYVNTYVDRLSSTSRNISVLYNNENHSRISNVDGAVGVDGKETRSVGQRASLNKAAQTSGQREDEQIASGRVISKLITNTQRISDRENSPRSIEMFARESLQYLDENKDQLGEQQTNEISGIINNLISSVNKSNSQTDLNSYVNTYMDRLSVKSQNISALYNDNSSMHMNNVQKQSRSNALELPKIALSSIVQNMSRQEKSSGALRDQMVDMQGSVAQENSMRNIDLFARESLQYLDENKDQFGVQQASEMSSIINNLVNSVNRNDRSSHRQNDVNSIMHSYINKISRSSQNISVVNQAYQNSKARATQLIQKMGERLNSPTSSSANSISESDMRLQNIRVNTEKITNLYDESESMLNMSKIETYKYQSQNQLIHAQDNTSENGNNLSGFKTTNVDKVINLSNTNIKNMANKTINLIENMDKMTTLMTNSLDNNSVEQMPEKITLKMILDSAEKASSGKSTGGLKSMLSVPADIVMFAPPAYMTPYGVDPNALGKRPAEKASPNRLMPANQTRQTDSADGFGSLNKKAGNDIMNMANKARSHQWNSPNNYRYTPPDMVMKNNGNNDEKNAMSQMNNLKSINQEMKKNTKILAKASATELSANQMKSIVDTVYQKFEKRMSRELKKRG